MKNRGQEAGSPSGAHRSQATPVGDTVSCPPVLHGYSTDEVRFRLAQDRDECRLDRDIDGAFQLIQSLAGRQQNRNLLNASDDFLRELNFWKENDTFVGWLKALRSLNDPPTQLVRVVTYPSWYGRPCGVAWGVAGEAPSARSLNRLRPFIAASPGATMAMDVAVKMRRSESISEWVYSDTVIRLAQGYQWANVLGNIAYSLSGVGDWIASTEGLSGLAETAWTRGLGGLAADAASAIGHPMDTLTGVADQIQGAAEGIGMAGYGLDRALDDAAGQSREMMAPQGNCFVASTPVLRGDGLTHTTIDRLQVGQRVRTSGLSDDQDSTTQIEPSRYRLVTAEMQGEGSVITIRTLMQIAELDAQRVEIGGRLYLHLDELQLSGRAKVLAIEDAPPIEPGPGRVILATVSATNKSDILRLALSDGTSLEVTSGHPLLSATRDAWLLAEDLEEGEDLTTGSGDVTVEEIERESEPQTVYTIEVEGEHRYFAGDAGVLAHNASLRGIGQLLARATDEGWLRSRMGARADFIRASGEAALREIEAVEGSSRTASRHVEQYALRAKQNGFFPVLERGKAAPIRYTFLREGEVWKFGTTVDSRRRYSQRWLDQQGLRIAPELRGSLEEAVDVQNRKIKNYLAQYGRLPPGNKVTQ